MRRKKQHAESSEQRIAKARTRSRFGRGVRRNIPTGFFLVLLIAALWAALSFRGRLVNAQPSPVPSPSTSPSASPTASPTPPPPIPDPIVVDVSKPDTLTPQYEFSGSEPRKETKLEFKGNDQDYSFVTFDQFPQNVSLIADGQPNGYRSSQRFEPGKWYWFKRKLPLILLIQKNAQRPFLISYAFGELRRGAEKEQARQTKPEDMQSFIDSHPNAFERNPATLAVGFTWAGTGAAKPTATATPAGSPEVNPTPEPFWLISLFNEDPLLVLVVGVIILLVITLIAVFFGPGLLSRIPRRGAGRQPNPARRNPSKLQTPPQPTTAPGDMYANLETNSSPSGSGIGLPEAESGSQTSGFNQGQKQSDRGHTRADAQRNDPKRHQPQVFYPPPKSATASPATVSEDGKLVQLENKLKTLEEQINQKLGKADGLTAAACSEVNKIVLRERDRILAEAEKRSKLTLDAEIRALHELMDGQASSVNTKLEQTAVQFTQVSTEGQDVKKRLLEALDALHLLEERIREQLKPFRGMVERQAAHDSFYAKTLGAVLGQNVESLQDENFVRLMGERLNQLFQTGFDRGEGLPDLRARVGQIHTAVKEVSAQIEKINDKALDKVRPHLQEVEKLVVDMSNMQSDLQDRRTVLHVPVAMYAGARQTFLDGLGRGIKREIEKLEDPEKYFESELERLITANLIAIVDICDKDVAAPGTHLELERTLNRLFEAAKLSQILPARGETFKAAQHDLIETVSGGQSLTVSEVVVRGFHYKHRDQETLLRKAGVKVYR